jgi:hypothetical protein
LISSVSESNADPQMAIHEFRADDVVAYGGFPPSGTIG